MIGAPEHEFREKEDGLRGQTDLPVFPAAHLAKRFEKIGVGDIIAAEEIPLPVASFFHSQQMAVDNVLDIVIIAAAMALARKNPESSPQIEINHTSDTIADTQ